MAETLRNRSFLLSALASFLMFAASLVSVVLSSAYADVSVSNSVTDIILSNTRVYDVDWIFVYGALSMVIFSAGVLFTIKLKALPFVLKSAALFLLVRSISVSLTHISPYPTRVLISENFISSYRLAQAIFSGNDLFFSGHVGLTFLVALLFWDTPVLRYIYLSMSIVFAVVVLLGHLHYSIDVFAAYFITYTIFVIARNIFKSDYERTLTVAAP
ncbi:hypothetical protein A3G63_01155 [Candidatus Kaiserbacteria bacterium RIFCSPLOWO2_12_FULL_52_8]|uniref:Sphingomyelin synthase-like domain-containing protein n=1 Tax=Candidatus Kaiserbacteria bacterium RIFCSPHIGHO2_01_FULL_53_31 TaxID=1798481 RepID=A0A1F6CIT7_9BACT|nr:MAG: hypothetical protein A2678_01005 [Candidatus Kaiserbacteria bacterium RIFCSPHIGHO2_01_FULL_53_31]OGG94673.1 MAG: hypothetical protein A3G63_01155 [Candidatus Kaiserbacteria bacterium RIFCSPLOWO2_12_FULL_52_8]